MNSRIVFFVTSNVVRGISLLFFFFFFTFLKILKKISFTKLGYNVKKS